LRAMLLYLTLGFSGSSQIISIFTFFLTFGMKLKVYNFESAVKDLLAGSVYFTGF
jgi:hypothetical protein